MSYGRPLREYFGRGRTPLLDPKVCHGIALYHRRKPDGGKDARLRLGWEIAFLSAPMRNFR